MDEHLVESSRLQHMSRQHEYLTNVIWTGNRGGGTLNYTAYERSFKISIVNKPDIAGSSDPLFRGDPSRYNPEELLVSSISSCHMLWYLHLCAEEGIVVTDYWDQATGSMIELPKGGGKFTRVTLSPKVMVSEDSMIERAYELHQKANELCFIANSVKCSVDHRPVIKAVDSTS